MIRVLVLGSTGMLGHIVTRVLSRSPDITVDGTQRQASAPLSFDAASGAPGLRALWRRPRAYQFVVNCIGLTRAAINEHDPRAVEAAIRVNAVFPHELAAVAAEFDARVLHVSTDGVFSGVAGDCAEDAPHDCLDVYGKTKSLGEVLAPHVVTLRCSIIGPDLQGRRRGLLEWFLALPEDHEVTGYTDSLWNGVTTLQLGTLCQRIIQHDAFGALRAESAVHHFCLKRVLSKYELLRLFAAVFQHRVRVRPGLTPGGPVTRVLVSRYQRLSDLLDGECELMDAMRDVAIERTLR